MYDTPRWNLYIPLAYFDRKSSHGSPVNWIVFCVLIFQKLVGKIKGPERADW
jgi:hypothetical protein